MTDPQGREMPEEGEEEPGNARSELSSEDKSKNLSHLTQDTVETSSSSAAKVTSPTFPSQKFAWRSDLELGWHAGEGPSAQMRQGYFSDAMEDKIWWQIRDYSFDSNDTTPAPEQRWSPWVPEDPQARSRSFEENLYRSDDTESYGQQDWYQMTPGLSGHGSQENLPFIIPDDDLSELPSDMPRAENNEASGGIMPQQDVSSGEPQAQKDSLDSWAPLYRYLGVKTDNEYEDMFNYYQPLDPIKESPLEEDNSDDAKEGAVGGAPK